jgi:hypothetical protein
MKEFRSSGENQLQLGDFKQKKNLVTDKLICMFYLYHLQSSNITYRCKTNVLPILMHQMRISTTQVSSKMLRSKKVGNPIKGETERAVWWKPECQEIEPNPSKDRAIPKGDYPSFWDELIKFTF